MAIHIKSLENIADQNTQVGSIYRDLFLDLQITQTKKPGFINPLPGKDLKTSVDLAAIGNSLSNLFSTMPGQRFLFPEYGTNLTRYLFDPITDKTAKAIGNSILTSITQWEPRVSVLNINITALPDDNAYNIDLLLEIPVLNLQSAQTSFLFDIKAQTIELIHTN